MSAPALQHDQIELSVLEVLLSAETTREGAAGLLRAIEPILEDAPAALALRDRDGLTLQVLAESGAPRDWPDRLATALARSGQPGVDAASGAFVVPMRSNGRDVGALLIGDTALGGVLLSDIRLRPVLDSAAAVLLKLASRSDAMVRRQATEMRSVSGILEGMAHQMANPLTGASAIAQLLVEEIEDERQRAAIRQIGHELGRAFVVLQDLLDFQRDTRAQDGVLDLNAVVERMARFRGYSIREQGIALEITTTAAFLPVRADARSLEHAILLALRFAELESHGTVNRCIAVRVLERTGGECAIAVTDSGTGAMPDVAPGWFDLQLSPAETGVGEPQDPAPDLGLVDSILRGSGGRLEVSASKTDGTTLTLVLRRATTASATPTPTHASRISA